MNTIITRPPSGGIVRAIPSKSVAHRLLICAFLSKLDIRGVCEGLSEDISATRDCLLALGGASGLLVYEDLPAHGDEEDRPILDCRESGSTLRFLLPLCGTAEREICLRGAGRLMKRPLSELKEQLVSHGCTISGEEDVICIRGGLRGGEYTLPGNVSSQYVSGLMFALPLLDEDSTIKIEGGLQSKPYVDLTIHSLRRSGIVVEEPGGEDTAAGEGSGTDQGQRTQNTVYRIPGRQKYKLPSFSENDIEGDWSNGAFWLVVKALGVDVTCEGLNKGSIQGDRKIVEMIEACRAEGEIRIDVGQTPDLVPAIALAAMGRKRGEVTKIVNAGRLRMKESDRIESVTAAIEGLGGLAKATEDEIHIMGTGEEKIKPVRPIDSFNDHRIVMMAAIGAILCDGSVEIKDSQAVRKSYPGFFDDYVSLGGEVITWKK